MVAPERPTFSPSAVPIVRLCVLRPIEATLADVGVNANSIIRKAGLARIPEDDELGFYPYFDAVTLLGHAARRSGVEHLGLLLAQKGGLFSLGPYGEYVTRAPTLYRAILRATALIKWISPQLKLSLHREGPLMVWRQAHPIGNQKHSHHAYLHTLHMQIEIIRLAAGPGWRPMAVHVGGNLRIDDQLQAFIRAPIRHVETEWGVVFPRHLLGRPMLADGGSGYDHSGDNLSDTMTPDNFAGSISELIQSFLSTGQASEKMFARICDMSLRTFQRNLIRVERKNFRELVANARLQAARKLLADPAIPLREITRALGYTEPANFTRAFVRWTGVSPREYRRQHLHSPAKTFGRQAIAGVKRQEVERGGMDKGQANRLA